jgi:hypothetical protein
LSSDETSPLNPEALLSQFLSATASPLEATFVVRFKITMKGPVMVFYIE